MFGFYVALPFLWNDSGAALTEGLGHVGSGAVAFGTFLVLVSDLGLGCITVSVNNKTGKFHMLVAVRI